MKGALLVLLLMALPGGAMAQTFPNLVSEDLNGATHSLPAELPSDPSVVFIAYKQNQQTAVNEWVAALGLTPGGRPDFVELPVVGAGAKLMRGVIDRGMRSGIQDTQMRARTIAIYQSPNVVNGPLGFAGRNEIRVLVVRRDGTVLFSTSGRVTAKGVADLQAALR